jgi:sulfur-oxidizing protein SoxZ
MAKNRLKAKAKKGVIDIKAIIAHPMETGLRKKKGKVIPANHLTNVVVTQNGTTVVNADVGGSISKDPFFKFKVAGKKGDEIVVNYVDNLGKKGTIKKKSK